MEPSLYREFMALVRQEGLDDPSWVLTLDEFDEPPLFTRFRQLEFLRLVPETQRVVATLEIMLSLLERHAQEIVSAGSEREYFLCVTFSDFDCWRNGEQLIPRPAIFVDPNEDEAKRLRLMLVDSYSAEGNEVAQWLAHLGPLGRQYCVGEVPVEVFDPELQKVYVGWRTDPAANIRSVGGDISGGRGAGHGHSTR